jgi:hypothetical protein
MPSRTSRNAGSSSGIEDIVQGQMALRRIDDGDHPLMPGAGRHRLEAGSSDRQQANPGEFGVRAQIAQAGVVARRVDVELAHRAGVMTQFGEDRVEAEDQACGRGHRRGRQEERCGAR